MPGGDGDGARGRLTRPGDRMRDAGGGAPLGQDQRGGSSARSRQCSSVTVKGPTPSVAGWRRRAQLLDQLDLLAAAGGERDMHLHLDRLAAIDADRQAHIAGHERGRSRPCRTGNAGGCRCRAPHGRTGAGRRRRCPWDRLPLAAAGTPPPARRRQSISIVGRKDLSCRWPFRIRPAHAASASPASA